MSGAKTPVSGFPAPGAVAQLVLAGADLVTAQAAMAAVDYGRTRQAHIFANHGLGANVMNGSRFTMLTALQLTDYDTSVTYLNYYRHQRDVAAAGRGEVRNQINGCNSAIDAARGRLADADTGIAAVQRDRAEFNGLPARIASHRQTIAANNSRIEAVNLLAGILGPPPPGLALEIQMRAAQNPILQQEIVTMQARIDAGAPDFDGREAALNTRRTQAQDTIATRTATRDALTQQLAAIDTFLADYAGHQTRKNQLAAQSDAQVLPMLGAIITHARNGTGGVTIDDNDGEAGGYAVFYPAGTRVGRTVAANAAQNNVRVIVAQTAAGHWYIHTANPY